MSYFAGVSKANLKTEYRRLAQRMHPDKGGDTKSFQAMKMEYEQRESGTFKKYDSAEKSNTYRYSDYSDYSDYSEYDSPYKKYFREPVVHHSTTYFDDYMNGRTRIFQYEGKKWEFEVNPSKKQYNLKDSDNSSVAVVYMSYVIRKITIDAKETNIASMRGTIVATVLADGFPIGAYLCDVDELRSGKFKFNKSKLLIGSANLDDWSIIKCTVDYDRYEKPSSIIGKVSDWIERKAYSFSK